MPANLTAEAQAKLAKYQQAKTLEEKIQALEEALSYVPDHKGTEKMRAQLKTTLAKLRRQAEHKRAFKATRHETFLIRKEGAAQVVLLGAANTGKSTLLSALTNAKPVVAAYPLTTVKPTPGMMRYEDVEIQLVELPAVLTEKLEETTFTSRSLALARNSDLITILLDASNNPAGQLEAVLRLLDEVGITLRRRKADVLIEKKDSGGVRLVVMGRFRGTLEDVKSLLENMGVKHAVVKIYGDACIEDVEEQVLRETTYKRAVIALNKFGASSMEGLGKVRMLAEELSLPVVELSAETGLGMNEFRETVFKALGIIRVYTQKDGVPSRRPIIVPKQATVTELARIIHKEFAENLRYAKVWGNSVKIQGQQVGPNHRLQDGDLIELFI